jgi:hypothetical protein
MFKPIPSSLLRSPAPGRRPLRAGLRSPAKGRAAPSDRTPLPSGPAVAPLLPGPVSGPGRTAVPWRAAVNGSRGALPPLGTGASAASDRSLGHPRPASRSVRTGRPAWGGASSLAHCIEIRSSRQVGRDRRARRSGLRIPMAMRGGPSGPALPFPSLSF